MSAHAITHARPRAHRAIERAAVVVHAALSTLLAARIAAAFAHEARAWLYAPLGLALGWLAADFASGFVHWLGDRYGAADSSFVGEALVRPFREHHDDPLAITRHGFVELVGAPCLVSAPVLALALAAHAGALASSFALALGGAVLATNAIHRWAHAANPPRAIAWLQARRLVLAPDAHRAHHAAPFDRAYCITTGWCNPLLGRTRFFERLERLVERTSGLKAQRTTH